MAAPHISIRLQQQDEVEIYHFAHDWIVKTKIDNDKAVRYYQEVLRLMNEMVVLLKENNTMLKQHARTVEELNDRVRKIGINTSNI
jgi:hypothetical protein